MNIRNNIRILNTWIGVPVALLCYIASLIIIMTHHGTTGAAVILIFLGIGINATTKKRIKNNKQVNE